MTFAPAFVRFVPHGICVAVHLPPRDDVFDAYRLGELHPLERAHVETIPPLRRASWVGGRLALRRALRELGVDAGDAPFFATPRGAPLVPPGAVGSISHKDTVALALVDLPRGFTVGVDVELDAARRSDIARHVLTEAERARIAHLGEEARARFVLVAFSIKEAIYKAIDPFVQRYVGFHEVEVVVNDDGSVGVSATLKRGEGPFAIDAWWERRDGIVLATARAQIARHTPSGAAPPGL